MSQSVIDRLRPGIVSLFAKKGYLADVTEDLNTGDIIVVVGKPNEAAVRKQFPLPSTNKELSEPLCRWRDELP